MQAPSSNNARRIGNCLGGSRGGFTALKTVFERGKTPPRDQGACKWSRFFPRARLAANEYGTPKALLIEKRGVEGFPCDATGV